jgi:hypothetical protein
MPRGDTDGDTVLVVTDPLIVNLRSWKRPPMLVKIDSDTFKVAISPESIKDYMISSLKDNGIGLITNSSTTWRDIELLILSMPDPINGSHKVPETVLKALLVAKKKSTDALKNITDFNEAELAAAQTTAAIDHINEDENWGIWSRAVIRAAEANIELCRLLQETAINTAKSGVFVDFTRYPWLNLKARASWHRPNNKNAYESWSPMGQASAYAGTKWAELREWAGSTSHPIHIGEDLDWPAYRDVYAIIRELKAQFGKEMHMLNLKYAQASSEYESRSDLDKDRMNDFKDLGTEYNQVLRTIAFELNSVDAVSAMVYRATVDRDKDTDEGLGFVWSCWGEEFVHTLRHINSGNASKRLVAVHMAKQYEDYTLQAGEYIVEQGGVRLQDYPETVIAYSKVPDGLYDIMVYDETPYLLIEVEKKNVESMAATFKDVNLKLIGFKYQVYEGELLTRSKVKELLELADYTITIASGVSGSNGEETYIDAMVYVDVPGLEEPVCIGNIPSKGAKTDESGYFAQALHNKVVRVSIPSDADKLDMAKKTGEMNRLSLKIIDIIEDLSR